MRLQKRQGLQRCDLKALSATNVSAGYLVVAADHVGLGFGEFCPIAFISVSR
jgi:hypothetical protein